MAGGGLTYLLDAITAALETGRLCSHVIRTGPRPRPACGLGGVEPRLGGGPAMALELVLTQLIVALTILGVRNQLRGRRSLALKPGRRTHRFVLADRGVPPIIGVVRIVIRNPAPPIGRVIIGKSRKI